jgi:hypothetical protein
MAIPHEVEVQGSLIGQIARATALRGLSDKSARNLHFMVCRIFTFEITLVFFLVVLGDLIPVSAHGLLI